MRAVALARGGTRVEDPSAGGYSATGGSPAPAGIQTGPPAEGGEGSDAPGLFMCPGGMSVEIPSLVQGPRIWKSLTSLPGIRREIGAGEAWGPCPSG